MPKLINFINHSGPYENAVNSLIEPIRLHLLDSIISAKPIPEAINIKFFRNLDETNTGIHVFMSHGIADKRWRDGNKVNGFDYICVSGPLWKTKMLKEGIAKEKILVTGYPKLDPIFQGKIKINSSSKKRILWAPTHGNTATSSYPSFKDYLNKIPSDFEVISSLHPYNKDDKQPTLQQLVDADVVIADSGSLLYEAWAVGKPVIFPDWLVKKAVIKYFPKSFEAKIYNEGIGLHAKNFNHLISLIYQALEQGLDNKVKKFIDGILPTNLHGTSGAEAACKLKEIAEKI